MKKWYAVIGNPIEHSMSPLMHSTWIEKERKDASYIPVLVLPENLKPAVTSLKLLGCSGWNVTIPHKESIIPLLDEIDDTAAQMGAVNTVVRMQDGRYKGYNTDGLGFVRSLEEAVGTEHRHKSVLIIGAGGAARGIAFALKKTGYRHINIANRTISKAEAICNDLDIEASALTLGKASEVLDRYDIIIQTTAAGLKNSEFSMPIGLNRLSKTAIVADIVYNPMMTPFLKEAKRSGATIVTGLGMFIHQGALSYSYWMGSYPNAKDVEELLIRQIGGN